MMLKQVRDRIIKTLWEDYLHSTQQMQVIHHLLLDKGIKHIILDHFAMIDLPGPNTGMNQLTQLFSAIGFIEHGNGYLADKQNDFRWMAEVNCEQLPASLALPQVVVADFRLEELPITVRRIVEKYTHQAPIAPITEVQELAKRTAQGEIDAAQLLTDRLTQYFAGRDWPLPTVEEFRTVQRFNELIAWVLIFGRKPNHFTLSIHHLPDFASIMEFHHFIEKETGLVLNQEGGKIKGGKSSGIAQSSTTGLMQKVHLSDGIIEVPMGFVEFVWRYPNHPSCQHPVLWNDYFTGFVAQYADHVIESLYLNEKKDNLSNVQG